MSAQVRESRQRRGEQLWSKQGHRRNQKTRTFPPRPVRFRHTHAVDRHLRRRVGIRAGRRAADFKGRNDGFRGAAAEMDVARDNVKELLLLTSPTLHCYLQKAWLSKGSERESLKALPLRVHTVAIRIYRLIKVESSEIGGWRISTGPSPLDLGIGAMA